MAVEVHVGALPDVSGVEAVAEGERHPRRIQHPQHPGVLLLAEGYALVARLAREDEAVVGGRGGEGEHALRRVAVRADRHRATLERHPVLRAHKSREAISGAKGVGGGVARGDDNFVPSWTLAVY